MKKPAIAGFSGELQGFLRENPYEKTRVKAGFLGKTRIKNPAFLRGFCRGFAGFCG